MMINRVKTINEKIADRMSKSIFENRLMYSLTNDYTYIANIVKGMREYKALLNTIKNLSVLYGTDKILIFGAGFWGEVVFRLLSDEFNIEGFIDNDENKNAFLGKRVYRVSEVKGKNDSIILVATRLYFFEIEAILVREGISAGRIIDIGSILMDYMYKKQYFDTDIVIHEKGKKEVFWDCGCYDCASMDSFNTWCQGEYSRIMAFEPSPSSYLKCVDCARERFRDTVVLNKALGIQTINVQFSNDERGMSSKIDKNGDYEVQMVSIDETANLYLKGTKTSFIKMDIEGYELEALRGGEKTIKECRPTLAICVYHKPEDIWEIPSYVLSLHEDYKIFFRHYSFADVETVMYAV